MLVGAEDAVVVTVGRVVWFESWWEGRKEVAPEAKEQKLGGLALGGRGLLMIESMWSCER